MTEPEKQKQTQRSDAHLADHVDLYQEAQSEKVREFAAQFARKHRDLLDRLAQ